MQATKTREFLRNKGSPRKSKFDLYKAAFLLKSSDVKFAKNLFTFGKCIYITPSHEISTFSKTWFTAEVVLFAAYLCLTTVVRHKRNKLMDYSFIMETVTNILSLTQMAVIGVGLLGRHIWKSNWELFFRHFERMEFIFSDLGFAQRKQLCLYYTQLALIYSFFFMFHVTDICLTHLSGQNWYGVYIQVKFGFAHFYMTYVFLFTLHLTSILISRNKFIQKTVIVAISEESEEVNITLDKMIESYEIMGNIVEQVNAFLGWHIFLFIQETFLSILFCILYVMRNIKLGKTTQQNFISTGLTTIAFSYNIVFLGSLVIFILSCDKVNKCNKKLITLCNLHAGNAKNPILKEKILTLGIYAENWKPTFSAAGFYDINIKSLSMIFSTLMSYVIVTLQFDL
ncbi:hypothetical protein JTB14_035706 [Gonioctena quinquepunctata]|nr:hypothetical protein JTB14_035706 [Gonioctena quinquepunctata]